MDEVIVCADAVMAFQRDYGDRKDRQRARFKYTIDDKGLDWIKAEIEQRLGTPFEEARPFNITSNGDNYGWNYKPDGRHHRTLFIRISLLDLKMLATPRAIGRIQLRTFCLTHNQTVTFPRVRTEAARALVMLLAEY